MASINDVIKIAEAEVGYLEKASNSQLDSKTANVGSKNYTKYARDLFPSLQGQAWCDMFVDWSFVQAYGKTAAEKILGGFSAYTPTSASYLPATSSPAVGDIIFFKNSTRICHTGIIYKVDSSKVYTIEGNTSGASGVIANGGGVCKKSYSKTYSKIAKFARPKWEYLPGGTVSTGSTSTSGSTTTTTTTSSGSSAIKSVQTWLNSNYSAGLTVDGVYGSKTKAALVKALQKWLNATYNAGLVVDGIFGAKTKAAVRVLKKGSTGTGVKILQGFLICNGYDTGGFDGDFGSKTDAAVRSYQGKKSITVDGEAGKNTFAKLAA